MTSISRIPSRELGKGSPIPLTVLKHEQDVYLDIALEMFDEIKRNNEAGKPTVFICPVGPVGHYAIFTRLANRYRLSCKDVYIFNMDEYLTADKQYISREHPMSFRGFMDRALYNALDPALAIPEDHRFFPEPGNERAVWAKIQELGGVDICFGGVGINGHIAFNEPPEPGEPMTNEEFMQLPSRVLRVARETVAINSMSGARGDIRDVPPYCITIGMKEILSSRKLHFSMYRPWQAGILRHVLHGPVTCAIPATFLQEHPNARLVISSDVHEAPEGRL